MNIRRLMLAMKVLFNHTNRCKLHYIYELIWKREIADREGYRFYCKCPGRDK